MSKLLIETSYPLCLDSLDYTDPYGAIYDDNCEKNYVNEVVSLFGRNISYLEIGCAGGSIVDYFVSLGHDAYGIEGTDHPLRIKRKAWLKHNGTRLINCDLSKPFKIIESPKFDVISAWEFMEHIPTKTLNHFMAKMYQILSEDGIMLMGISTHPHEKHPSAYPREWWEKNVFDDLFETHDYDLQHFYREYPEGGIKVHGSFFVKLKAKKNMSNRAEEIINDFERNFGG